MFSFVQNESKLNEYQSSQKLLTNYVLKLRKYQYLKATFKVQEIKEALSVDLRFLELYMAVFY